jgi:hypothetical protein
LQRDSDILNLRISLLLQYSGLLARDSDILRKVGHIMLQQPALQTKLPKRAVIAEDCFNLLKSSQNRDLWIAVSAAEKTFGSKEPKSDQLSDMIQFSLYF